MTHSLMDYSNFPLLLAASTIAAVGTPTATDNPQQTGQSSQYFPSPALLRHSYEGDGLAYNYLFLMGTRKVAKSEC